MSDTHSTTPCSFARIKGDTVCEKEAFNGTISELKAYISKTYIAGTRFLLIDHTRQNHLVIYEA